MQPSYKIATLSFLLLIGVFAVAGETFTGRHDFGSDGLLWNYNPQKWTDNTNVSWIHTLSGFQSSHSVTTATLPSHSVGDKWSPRGVSNRSNSSQSAVGRSGHGWVLAHSRNERFTSSRSDAYSSQSRTHWSDFDRRNNSPGGSVFFRDNSENSKWKFPQGIGFEDCYEPTVTPATVPAPSAIILTGLGTVLVGFLRRRKQHN